MLQNFIHLQYCYNYLINQISVNLLLYSHIPSAVIALIFGSFLIFNARKLPNVMLFLVCASFSIWCFLDLGSWFSFLGSGSMMFTWSLADLFAPLFFFFSYYFVYTFLTGIDVPLWQKLLSSAAISPIAVWVLLGKKLTVYEANLCEANENATFNNYQFLVEGLFLLAIITFAIILYWRTKDNLLRKRIVLTTTGIFIFLSVFLSSTLGVNFLVNDTAVQYAYNLEIYGLFGMPVLLIYLGYLIVRYQAFNLKMIGAQALIITLLGLVASQIFFASSTPALIVNAATIALVIVFGYFLVRGVKREIAQREMIEEQEKELEVANRKQESLLHFITHEVKGYLTKNKAVFASISEGDFPGVPPLLLDISKRALEDTDKGVATVRDILDSSNLKRGTTEYAQKQFDMRIAAEEAIADFQTVAKEKGLILSANIQDGTYTYVGDEEKLKRHVIRNLIDNAIKYTPTGAIMVSLSKTPDNIIFSVSDTGVGIDSADMKRLFTEGGKGKDSIRVNVDSTGYGLFIAKVVVDGHHGTIEAASEGQGKGSTFTVKFPTN